MTFFYLRLKQVYALKKAFKAGLCAEDDTEASLEFFLGGLPLLCLLKIEAGLEGIFRLLQDFELRREIFQMFSHLIIMHIFIVS